MRIFLFLLLSLSTCFSQSFTSSLFTVLADTNGIIRWPTNFSATNIVSGVTTNIPVSNGTLYVTNGLIKKFSNNSFLFQDLVNNPSLAKIAIPMYVTPPSVEWTNLFALGSNYVSVISVTVDASQDGFGGHGPGTNTQANWLWAITNAQAVGIKVVGYVEPQYGSIPLATVFDQIDKWYQYYPTIDGIFLDEVDFSGQNEWYMQQVSSHIRSFDKNLIVFNPGWFLDTETVMDMCDIVMCSETYYNTFLGLVYPNPWIYNYPSWRLWEITHSCTNNVGAPNVSGCDVTWNLSKARNAGHIFVTEQPMDYPWIGLGALISEQTNLVKQVTSTNLLASVLKDVEIEVSPYFTYPVVFNVSTVYNKGTYTNIYYVNPSGTVSLNYDGGMSGLPYFNFTGSGYLVNTDYERNQKLTTWCIFKTSNTGRQTLIGGQFGDFRLFTTNLQSAIAYPVNQISTNTFTSGDYHLVVAIHSEYQYLARLYLDGILQHPWTGSWYHLYQIGIGGNADGGDKFVGRMRSAGVIGHAISDDEHNKIISYARNVWGLGI
jgi:hypothetical protein